MMMIIIIIIIIVRAMRTTNPTYGLPFLLWEVLHHTSELWHKKSSHDEHFIWCQVPNYNVMSRNTLCSAIANMSIQMCTHTHKKKHNILIIYMSRDNLMKRRNLFLRRKKFLSTTVTFIMDLTHLGFKKYRWWLNHDVTYHEASKNGKHFFCLAFERQQIRISAGTLAVFPSLSTHIYYLVQSVYRLSRGWTGGVQFPAEARDFPILRSSQIGSEAHPASCLKITGAAFPNIKLAGMWIWPFTSI
jgi:hypothetical protein